MVTVKIEWFELVMLKMLFQFSLMMKILLETQDTNIGLLMLGILQRDLSSTSLNTVITIISNSSWPKMAKSNTKTTSKSLLALTKTTPNPVKLMKMTQTFVFSKEQLNTQLPTTESCSHRTDSLKRVDPKKQRRQRKERRKEYFRFGKSDYY